MDTDSLRLTRKSCKHCSGRHWRIEPETGERLVSLHNAHALLDRIGEPDKIRLEFGLNCEPQVTFIWSETSHRHVFMGFVLETPPLPTDALPWCLCRLHGLPAHYLGDWPRKGTVGNKCIEFERSQAGWRQVE